MWLSLTLLLSLSLPSCFSFLFPLCPYICTNMARHQFSVLESVNTVDSSWLLMLCSTTICPDNQGTKYKTKNCIHTYKHTYITYNLSYYVFFLTLLEKRGNLQWLQYHLEINWLIPVKKLKQPATTWCITQNVVKDYVCPQTLHWVSTKHVCRKPCNSRMTCISPQRKSQNWCKDPALLERVHHNPWGFFQSLVIFLLELVSYSLT